MAINDKSIDGVLGTQTWGGRRMVGTDESTELWRHPKKKKAENKFNSSMLAAHINVVRMLNDALTEACAIQASQ